MKFCHERSLLITADDIKVDLGGHIKFQINLKTAKRKKQKMKFSDHFEVDRYVTVVRECVVLYKLSRWT